MQLHYRDSLKRSARCYLDWGTSLHPFQSTNNLSWCVGWTSF